MAVTATAEMLASMLLSRRVLVTRQCDGLTREEWRLWYDDRIHVLVLDEYQLLRRESILHRKYRPAATYSRIPHRGCTLRVGETPLPDEVRTAARDAFCRALTVEKEQPR